ncbi:MAG: hypothetical protein LPH21_10460 [Shewanella sp.]|nr:hypothetical protein [Shewanella sp.]MCF1430413.1 hypothetical protein [Shewanella sp.]MCF1457950.1 hypothetical protein [Shewanella sp.]
MLTDSHAADLLKQSGKSLYFDIGELAVIKIGADYQPVFRLMANLGSRCFMR